MATTKTVTKIVLISIICAATMIPIAISEDNTDLSVCDEMDLSIYMCGEVATVPPDYDTLMSSYRSKVIDFNIAVRQARGHAKQTIVPDNFIGPLAINQEYENETRTVNMTTFYGNILTIDVSEYYRR